MTVRDTNTGGLGGRTTAADARDARSQGMERDAVVPRVVVEADTVEALDVGTRALVRLSAIICASSELALRVAIEDARGVADPRWIEELILQSYLFAGLPRALNAMREWRRLSGVEAPERDPDAEDEQPGEWRARGEAACALVYGRFYERLRHNIAELHPALDVWMINDGYGKVLSRDGLDLRRRELCVVAACAAMQQDRQLHSHLHGALHVGARPNEIDATLAVVRDLLDADAWDRVARLWARVRGH